jgi:hypothetical protein
MMTATPLPEGSILTPEEIIALPTHADLMRERGRDLPPALVARRESAAHDLAPENAVFERRAQRLAEAWDQVVAPRHRSALPTKTSCLTPEREAEIDDMVARTLERLALEEAWAKHEATAAINVLIEEKVRTA